MVPFQDWNRCQPWGKRSEETGVRGQDTRGRLPAKIAKYTPTSSGPIQISRSDRLSKMSATVRSSSTQGQTTAVWQTTLKFHSLKSLLITDRPINESIGVLSMTVLAITHRPIHRTTILGRIISPQVIGLSLQCQSAEFSSSSVKARQQGKLILNCVSYRATRSVRLRTERPLM